MRAINLVTTGTGVSAPAIMDRHIAPFNVSLGLYNATLGTGGTYTVQHTFDLLLAFGSVATWYDHPYLANVGLPIDGNYAFPVAAIRLRCLGTPNLGGFGMANGTLVITQAGIA